MVLRLIAFALMAPTLAMAKVEITPDLLGRYLTSQGNECRPTDVFAHGEIAYRGKTGQGWSVQCSNGKQYAVAVEHDERQTAWWATCEALSKNSRYQCFKK